MTTQHQPHYIRFWPSDRILHFLLGISFTVLAFTGLIQKYADHGIAVWFIRLMGGIEQTRVFHHMFAVLLILVSIVHLVQVGNRLFVQRKSMSMLPTLKDFTDFFTAVKYNLGISKKKPNFPRFNFMEKLEYWAVVWGTALMTITGYALWNPILVTRFLPGEVVPAAKIAHGMEALLAVLSIITWHFYFVHLRVFNKSMLHGAISEEEMADEHPLELEQIKQGKIWQPPAPDVRYRRLKLYAPLATLFVLVSVLGTWRWLTAEKTAITTVPRTVVQEEAYQPVLPTPAALQLTPVVRPTPLSQLRIADLSKQSGGASLITHPIDGERAQCATCHDVNSQIDPAPMDHADYKDDTCLTCHSLEGATP